MALILSQAARLKPELRLANAVSRFEASLSNDQKIAFRNQRSKALSSPPDPSDVMRFTADIDRRESGKAGRCLGPRFTNFMQGVQQFAALGDVIVGGSQNIIACGVWSLVRMSILVVVNFSTYLEKISFVFMEFGRSIPRHQEIALLYPRSDSLQAHINEYFIVVVDFCQKVLDFAQKSVLGQITSTLSDTKIKTTQSELDIWSSEIRDELRVLSAKRIEEEAGENVRFRSLSKIFSKSVAQQQEIVAKLRILKKCSTYNHETTWKQIRKIGNTSLFTQDDDYGNWKAQTKSCTLLYLGILGCGKSVMLANMVDDLNLSIEKADASVAYFFTRHDLPESLRSVTVIGSIVRQLLHSKNDLPAIEQNASNVLSVDDMLGLLQHAHPPRHMTYLVLDGLDICDPSERQEIVKFLRRLQEDRCLLVCASSRLEPKVDFDATMKQFKSVRAVSIPDNHPDIEAFIDTELSRRLSNDSLKIGDASLILDIQDALLSGSKGMFLWVAMQIQAICMLQTDEKIQHALQNMPKDLGDIYFELLRRCQGPGTQYQQRILELITAAQRPLTTSELREALSVTPGDTTWTTNKLLNEIYSTLATCGCLVVVDEEELTVRFVHPTVNQFFLDRYVDAENQRANLEHCHHMMAETIVTYLSYGIFATEVSTFRVPQIDAGIAPSKIISSTMESSTRVQGLAMKLLSRRKQPNFNVGKTLAEELYGDKQPEAIEYHFQHYASLYCLEHISRARDVGQCVAQLLPPLIHRATKSNSTTLNLEKVWNTVLEKRNLPMAHMLVKITKQLEPDSPPPLLVDSRRSLWFYSIAMVESAICEGEDELVEVFLSNKETYNLINEATFNLIMKPCFITYFGDGDRLRILVENCRTSKTSHICKSGRTPIASAIWANNLKALEVLLTKKYGLWNINTGPPGKTPIWDAVRKGRYEALEMLLLTYELDLGPAEMKDLIKLAQEKGFEGIVGLLKSARATQISSLAREEEAEKDHESWIQG